jgi:hypothetical protein
VQLGLRRRVYKFDRGRISAGNDTYYEDKQKLIEKIIADVDYEKFIADKII